MPPSAIGCSIFSMSQIRVRIMNTSQPVKKGRHARGKRASSL
jgi:hypothetical protein